MYNPIARLPFATIAQDVNCNITVIVALLLITVHIVLWYQLNNVQVVIYGVNDDLLLGPFYF